VRLLLDTHALIWWVDQDHLLSPTSYAAIADPDNELLLSAATIWEIALKVGTKKLALSLPYRQWMLRAMSDLGVTVLPVTVEYADIQAGLSPHHRDPFDRLLVAQALYEQIPLVSADPQLNAYGITRIW
jgi:PIN domain nuclease of toxin-antitoxin system